jgi:hypothetical protein
MDIVLEKKPVIGIGKNRLHHALLHE